MGITQALISSPSVNHASKILLFDFRLDNDRQIYPHSFAFVLKSELEDVAGGFSPPAPYIAAVIDVGNRRNIQQVESLETCIARQAFKRLKTYPEWPWIIWHTLEITRGIKLAGEIWDKIQYVIKGAALLRPSGVLDEFRVDNMEEKGWNADFNSYRRWKELVKPVIL